MVAVRAARVVLRSWWWLEEFGFAIPVVAFRVRVRRSMWVTGQASAEAGSSVRLGGERQVAWLRSVPWFTTGATHVAAGLATAVVVPCGSVVAAVGVIEVAWWLCGRPGLSFDHGGGSVLVGAVCVLWLR
ncbi:hypothetical protein GCM10009827_090280 [Dactylosporangium maewongense]|uniref:Integral membrane protein n=1 Tax=Dactylosporangium maewongense TaxID=634393 RepID=A0ABP4N4L0_9ACTN